MNKKLNVLMFVSDHLGQNSSSDVMAFRAVLKLTPSFPTNPIYEELCQMIRNHSAAPPFCVPNYHKLYEDASVPIEAAHLYDAVVLWARAATAAMRAGLPATDGATLMKLLRPTTYRSVQGFDVSFIEDTDTIVVYVSIMFDVKKVIKKCQSSSSGSVLGPTSTNRTAREQRPSSTHPTLTSVFRDQSRLRYKQTDAL
ncbi:uncharacterized protein LOC134791559 [Cydia splendana]|uniref:uncharacterized protein LOC134791559 n=1 Tax=Cydia splendana TaxID=1100963 RepID=UPI00300D99EF